MMSNYKLNLALLLGLGLLAVAWASDVAAAPRDFSAPALLGGSLSVATAATVDVQDQIATYLRPHSRPAPQVTELLLSDPPPRVSLAVYNAPATVHASPPPVPAIIVATDPVPPESLTSFSFPQATGLAGSESDERDVPFGSTAVLAMGPGGFGRVMTGRSPGAMSNWTQATETAMSYVRPHVNVQMLFAMEMPVVETSDGFEGPGMEPHAYLAVNHITRVDSADLGAATERYGLRSRPTPVDEPHTALAAGLDLGLLPTFLSQMGLNVSLVASRGTATGRLTVAVAGTTELPVDWAPRERPYQHPTATGAQPLIADAVRPMVWSDASVSGSKDIAGPPGPPPPPNPQTPEPATLTLLGVAAAALLARRRRSSISRPQ